MISKHLCHQKQLFFQRSQALQADEATEDAELKAKTIAVFVQALLINVSRESLPSTK